MKTLLVIIAVLVALVLFCPMVIGWAIALSLTVLVWLANLASVHWLATAIIAVALYVWLK